MRYPATPAVMVNQIQNVLWIIAPLAQLGLIFMMLRRQFVRRLPWFFGYTVFHVAQFVLLFVSHRISYATYFYAYWSTEAIDALLTLIVLQELFTEVFRPYEGIRELVLLTFRWGMLLLVLLAVISAAAASGSESDRVIAALIVMERSVNFVQCGLLALLIAMYKLAGFTWRSVPIVIGFGFGIVASISTVVMAVRAYAKPGADQYFSLVYAAAYDLGVFVWVIAIFVPVRQLVTGELPAGVVLEEWNEALLGLMNR